MNGKNSSVEPVPLSLRQSVHYPRRSPPNQDFSHPKIKNQELSAVISRLEKKNTP